jgi:hypothetical protein
MRSLLLSLPVLFSMTAAATAWDRAVPAERGSWVSLQVAVDDEAMPLYASADGSRFYVEARPRGHYDLQIVNRTGERVGVELTVDGLNVISGERDQPGPDRMYILGPWESTTVRGWRSSLDEVRRFTFVDEKVSYAARSGKANSKMGWIEMEVYRERTRERRQTRRGWWPWRTPREEAPEAEAKRRDTDDRGARAGSPAEKSEGADAQARPESAPRSAAPAPAQSYPGTGWGESLEDRVRLVDFDAETTPAERLVLRYEYRAALRALGVLPDDRLSQRERGDRGFAKPPRW